MSLTTVSLENNDAVAKKKLDYKLYFRRMKMEEKQLMLSLIPKLRLGIKKHYFEKKTEMHLIQRKSANSNVKNM